MEEIVTRFAPSNTGYLHCGSVRTALFSIAYAKHCNGKSILRIEDTDVSRSTNEYLLDILNGLEWLGLKFDEGVKLEDVVNNFYSSDYFQSKRNDRYNNIINQLLETDYTYEKDGAIYFKMVKVETIFIDEIIGEISISADECEDFIIRKSNGNPVFHLTVVVDDIDMGITHVIRGQDHISNTFKHIRIFEALGANVPKFAHIPLILDNSGAKLSKRRTDQYVLIKDFRSAGFLPEVILNYLALLGWSPGNDIEHFDLDFFYQKFDIKDVGKANGRFDYKKFKNFNATAINKMALDKFSVHVINYGNYFYPQFIQKCIELGILIKIIIAYKPRIKTLKDIFDNGLFFISDEDVKYSEEAIKITMVKNNGYDILEKIVNKLEKIENWEEIRLHLEIFMEELNLKLVDIAQPIRVAVSGDTVSPPIDETLIILGKEKTIKRIRKCLENKEVKV